MIETFLRPRSSEGPNGRKSTTLRRKSRHVAKAEEEFLSRGGTRSEAADEDADAGADDHVELDARALERSDRTDVTEALRASRTENESHTPREETSREPSQRRRHERVGRCFDRGARRGRHLGKRDACTRQRAHVGGDRMARAQTDDGDAITRGRGRDLRR
jgi:hypothetical protein